MKTTRIFIVINEETLLTMKGKNNKTAKFATYEDANWHAAQKLSIWAVHEVNFSHPWLHHEL